MDTSGATYEELVTIMGHIMPEPEVEIREGVTTALWRFGEATGGATAELSKLGVTTINEVREFAADDFVRLNEAFKNGRRFTGMFTVRGVRSWLPFAWKLDPAYQRYQRRATRLNTRPRPSKRHGERRGVK